ncbi:UNVERIFIED_CONTAM: acyl-CoA dehydrogenase N-terminal domain-containing protein, partial [Microbacterium sp. SLM126]
MSYTAPTKDMMFVIQELAGLTDIATLPGFGDATPETVEAVLEEAARFHGQVRTTAGFRDAFRQFGEGGWQGIVHPTEFGGQGLPKLVATPC